MFNRSITFVGRTLKRAEHMLPPFDLLCIASSVHYQFKLLLHIRLYMSDTCLQALLSINS